MSEQEDARTAWNTQIKAHHDLLQDLNARYDLLAIAMTASTSFVIVRARAALTREKLNATEMEAIERLFDVEIEPGLGAHDLDVGTGGIYHRTYADIDRLLHASLQLGDVFFDQFKKSMDQLHALAGEKGWLLPENWEESHEHGFSKLRTTTHEMQDAMVEAFAEIDRTDVITDPNPADIEKVQATLGLILRAAKGTSQAQDALMSFLEQMLTWDPTAGKFIEVNPFEELLKGILGDDFGKVQIINAGDLGSIDNG